MTLGSNSGLSIGTGSAAPSQGLLVQGNGSFSNNLGVGTASNESGWRFDVAGIATMGGTAGNGRLYISTEGTTNGATYIQARNLSVGTPLRFFSSVNIFDSNVLINKTNNEGFNLDVNGTGRFSGRLLINSSTNYSALQNTNTSGNIYWGIDNSTGSDFTGVSYARFIYSEGAYPLITYVNGAERMRIASTGAATFSNLAGSGTRMVVADANGLLSTQAIGSGSITGTGDANYLPKFTGASTIGNSQIFDNGTFVGIGTASPTQKLEVNGVIESYYLEFKPVVFYDFNSDTTGDWSKGNSTLSVPNDSVTRYTSTGPDSNISKTFNFDGGQNQIIRIRYKVVSGFSGGGEIFYANSQHSFSASYFKGFNLVSDGAWHTLVLDMSSLTAGGTDWIDYNVTQIRFDLTNNSGVVIDIDWISIGGNGYGTQYFENDVAFMNGNVGIGTDSPSAMLTLLGLTPYIRIERSGVNTWQIQNNNQVGTITGFAINNITAGTVPFLINQATGNLLLGSTSDNGFRLDVNGTGRFSGALTTNGTRPIVLNASSGNVNIQGETGGWAVQYGFSGNAGTNRGGFGALGGTNDLSYWFIGKAYNDNALSLDFSTGAATFSSSVTAGGNINSRTAVYPQIQFQETTSATNSLIYYDNVSATKLMGFRVNSGSNVMNLTSTNVGIGTASPQAPLHVIAASSADNALIQEWSYTSGTTDQYSLMLKQTVTSGVVRYNFSMVNNSVAYDNVLVLDRGNVGIGTTSPAYSLDVNGSTNVSANNFYRYNGDTGIFGSATAITGGINTQLGIRAASDILFATNGANERMRITASGRVLIGNPPPAESTFTLDVNGTGRFSGGTSNIPLQITSSSSNGTILGLINTNAGTNSWGINSYTNGILYFQYGTLGSGSNPFYVTSLGAATFSSSVTASNFITTSDRRLKSEIKEIKNAISILSKFASYEYVKDGKQDAGFIAQEVKEAIPYSVFKNNDDILTMSDRPILAYIHKAILELNERINKLEK
jgi:hypothetical protein